MSEETIHPVEGAEAVREAFEIAADAIQRAAREDGADSPMDRGDAEHLAQVALATLPTPVALPKAGEVEPVALLHEHPDEWPTVELYNHGAGCLTEADRAAGYTETPLYASPPTPAAIPTAAVAWVTAKAMERLRNNKAAVHEDVLPSKMREHVVPLYATPHGLTERYRAAARKAHDTLIELNPSNYSHDDVCEANNATIEAILLLADVLGERHGKTEEWWNQRRAALQRPGDEQKEVGV